MIGQWNVRTILEMGKCAQVTKEMQRYGISILGVSEMRWNSGEKMMTATGELCCTREWMKAREASSLDEGENHARALA